MNDSFFTRITAWITYSLALYSWSISFNNGLLIWIPYGAILLISFLCIIHGARKVALLLVFPGIRFPLNKLILASSSFFLFIGSMNGLLDILFKLPVQDRSFLLLPIITSACILGGASINLAQMD